MNVFAILSVTLDLNIMFLISVFWKNGLNDIHLQMQVKVKVQKIYRLQKNLFLCFLIFLLSTENVWRNRLQNLFIDSLTLTLTLPMRWVIDCHDNIRPRPVLHLCIRIRISLDLGQEEILRLSWEVWVYVYVKKNLSLNLSLLFFLNFLITITLTSPVIYSTFQARNG